MLGLELRDTAVIAVLIDEGGWVRKRSQAAGDPAVGAVAAIESVISTSNASGAARALGVAAGNLDSPAVARVLSALLSRFPDLPHHDRVIGSGTAAAIAEAWIGAARGVPDVVYFSVADHAFAGMVRDGRPVTGAHGRASAVAWLSLNPGDHSRVLDAVNGDLGAITLDHVLDAARDRDGVSVSVIRDTAKYLGMAAANLVAIDDPQMLVLGGIMASAADLLLDPIRTELAHRLPAQMSGALMVSTATLDSDAAAIGAARYASSQ